MSKRLVMAAAGLLTVVQACGAELPPSVIEGSDVKVGWTHDFTSTNTASRDGATVGNRDVSAMTRTQFATLVNGDVVTDADFGKVSIRDDDPESFTVRYDLKEPSWSDGVPLDAADLLLAWAAGSNALTQEGFDSLPGELVHSTTVPSYDESARSIDVRFSRPVAGWQTALDVSVPAHVVAQRADEAALRHVCIEPSLGVARDLVMGSA